MRRALGMAGASPISLLVEGPAPRGTWPSASFSAILPGRPRSGAGATARVSHPLQGPAFLTQCSENGAHCRAGLPAAALAPSCGTPQARRHSALSGHAAPTISRRGRTRAQAPEPPVQSAESAESKSTSAPAAKGPGVGFGGKAGAAATPRRDSKSRPRPKPAGNSDEKNVTPGLKFDGKSNPGVEFEGQSHPSPKIESGKPVASGGKKAVVRRAAPQRPLLGDEPSQASQQTETAIVSTLVVIFVIILLEGIFLASAGFLPEEFDTFAFDSVYPAFSPTVGLFLLLATGYGLFKFLGPKI